MTQPPSMQTAEYVYGVEKLNGHDAWSLFEAAAVGDVERTETLLAKDRRLVNAQYWYQFPIHLAVSAGHVEIVELLLDHGADPGQSIYTYNSWDKLLARARELGHRRIIPLLERAMRKRFRYSPDFEELQQAIIAKDARKIGSLLRRNPHLISAADALGNNALHWSVLTRQLGLIERFVDLGTPIDAKRADGQTPTLNAVNGATDYWYRETRGRSHPSLRNTSLLVGSLLAHGASYTISIAAAVGDQERVEQLIAKDAELARRLDSARISPLSYAAQAGHLHIVKLLIEHGADPNQPEDAAPLGRALFEACCANHYEIARLLLERGANPNAGTDSNECCLTICAVYHGERARPLQELLRKHGAITPPYRMSVRELKQAIRDKHEVTHHDEFADCIMRTRNTALIDLYLDSGKSAVEQVDPVSFIGAPKSSAFIRKLLDRGLDPNYSDWLGNTLLHACASCADLSVAALLLDAGADINAREAEFRGTPLATAVRSCTADQNHKSAAQGRKMIRLLLKRGAAVNLPGDPPWATPLAWARKNGLADVEQMLAKHGAGAR